MAWELTIRSSSIEMSRFVLEGGMHVPWPSHVGVLSGVAYCRKSENMHFDKENKLFLSINTKYNGQWGALGIRPLHLDGTWTTVLLIGDWLAIFLYTRNSELIWFGNIATKSLVLFMVIGAQFLASAGTSSHRFRNITLLPTFAISYLFRTESICLHILFALCCSFESSLCLLYVGTQLKSWSKFYRFLYNSAN